MAINEYLDLPFLDLNNKFLYNSILENNIKIILNYYQQTLNILETQTLLSNYKKIKGISDSNNNWIYSLQDDILKSKTDIFKYNSYSKYNILNYNNFDTFNIVSIVDKDLLYINNFYNNLYNKEISHFYMYYLYIGYLNNFDILNLEKNNSIITKYINNFNIKNDISKYLESKCQNQNCNAGLINSPFFYSLFLKEFIEKSYSNNFSVIKNNVKTQYPLSFENSDIQFSFKKGTSLFDLNKFSLFFCNSILKIPIQYNDDNDFVNLISSNMSKIFDYYTQDFEYENSIQKSFDSYINDKVNSKKIKENLFNNLFSSVFGDIIIKNFDFDSFFKNKEQLIEEIKNREYQIFQTIKLNMESKKKLQIKSIEYINSQFKEEFNNFILSYSSSYMLYYDYLISKEFYSDIGIYSLVEENGDDYLTIENLVNIIKNNIHINNKIEYNVKNDIINAIDYSFFNTFSNIIVDFCNSKYLKEWIENSLIYNVYEVSIKYRNLYTNELFLNYDLIQFYIKVMLTNLLLNNFNSNVDKLFNFEYNSFKSKINSIPNEYFDIEFEPKKLLNLINNEFNSNKKQNIKSFSDKIKKEYLALFLSKFINDSLYKYKI